jgi:hypothetical protein
MGRTALSALISSPGGLVSGWITLGLGVSDDHFPFKVVLPPPTLRNISLGAQRLCVPLVVARRCGNPPIRGLRSDRNAVALRIYQGRKDPAPAAWLYGHPGFLPLPPHQKYGPQLPVLEKCPSIS